LVKTNYFSVYSVLCTTIQKIYQKP